MSKWTLRPQRTRDLRRGEQQEHTAALRATRYVRRHAWQFHGAGVQDAVRDLPGINAVPAIRGALTKLAASLNIPGPLRLAFDDTLLLPETAHGLTVVGWKHPVTTGIYYCPSHRPMGGVPVTAADVTASFECWNCGTRLLGPVVVGWMPDGDRIQPMCLCTHPRSAHNVNGLCIALPGVLGCGCLGWSESDGS